MWAWVFIYTYVFEYHLGEETFDKNVQFSISLIQYSDTGYFENDNDNRTNISAYECEEESGSKLLFYFELKPKKKDWIWNLEDIIMNKEYASIKHERTTLISSKGNIQILYSFALDNFLTEESTMKALKLFTDYCTDKCNIEFNLV